MCIYLSFHFLLNSFLGWLAVTTDIFARHSRHGVSFHQYKKQKAIRDHGYTKYNINPFIIHQQYADDIGWITHLIETSRLLRREVPTRLKLKNLLVNDTKTEDLEVEINGDKKWMLCKYLGSIIDIENDINRRKTFALAAFNSQKHIFDSRRATLEVKIRLFNNHIRCIFLYNSKLWTLPKSLENTINVFQKKDLEEDHKY